MQNLLPYTTVSKRNGITEGYFDLIKLQKKAASSIILPEGKEKSNGWLREPRKKTHKETS